MARNAGWLKHRIARIAGAGVTGLAMAAVSCAAASASAGTMPATGQSQDPVDAQRALATYQALQGNLYDPKYRLYQCDSATCAKDNLFGTLWPFTNAFSATNYLAGTPGTDGNLTSALAARDKGLAAYDDSDETNPAGLAQLPAYASTALPPLGPGADVLRRQRLGGAG
jgi:hypothetical protein